MPPHYTTAFCSQKEGGELTEYRCVVMLPACGAGQDVGPHDGDVQHVLRRQGRGLLGRAHASLLRRCVCRPTKLRPDATSFDRCRWSVALFDTGRGPCWVLIGDAGRVIDYVIHTPDRSRNLRSCSRRKLQTSRTTCRSDDGECCRLVSCSCHVHMDLHVDTRAGQRTDQGPEPGQRFRNVHDWRHDRKLVVQVSMHSLHDNFSPCPQSYLGGGTLWTL